MIDALIGDLERLAKPEEVEKVSLTDAGALLVRHAERMLAEAETASAALEAMNSAPQGEVRVAAPIVLGQALLGPLVQAFLSENPDCDVSLNLTNRQVDLVEEGYDVAIRVREPGDADLIARKLGIATTGLYCDRTNAKAELAAPAELAERPLGLVQPDGAPRTSLMLVNSKGESERTPIQCHIWTTNPWVMMDAMAGTDMITPAPDRGEAVRRDETRSRRLVWPFCGSVRRLRVASPYATSR